MAEYFRRNNVRTILDFGFTKSMTLDQVRPYHDYAIETQRRFSDVIFGNWLQIDPRLGGAAVDEIERCIDESDGFIGYCVSARRHGLSPPATRSTTRSIDCRSTTTSRCWCWWATPARARALPGGEGVKLDLCHPRYVDELAMQLSDAEDHRRPAGVAVAGRDDRGDAAQAQRVGRAARLVAEISDRAAQATRHCAPAEETA